MDNSPAGGARRLDDLQRFYAILDSLCAVTGGMRLLSHSDGRMNWPQRGVYFFYEPGERRSGNGAGPRVVRVGTHALKDGSRTTLWKRLSQHRGTQKTGGGNHRGSIFRLLVGAALMQKEGLASPAWGNGGTAPKHIRAQEQGLERQVSKVIGGMPFVWLAITDEAGPHSRRGYIERNAIALLGGYGKPPVDAPSPQWLGHHCNRGRVRRSGLWNQNHTDETYHPDFLDEMEKLTATMGRAP